MSQGINKRIGGWRVKNDSFWGVICGDSRTAILQSKSGIAGGKYVIIVGRSIRIMECVPGGLGN